MSLSQILDERQYISFVESEGHMLSQNLLHKDYQEHVTIRNSDVQVCCIAKILTILSQSDNFHRCSLQKGALDLNTTLHGYLIGWHHVF